MTGGAVRQAGQQERVAADRRRVAGEISACVRRQAATQLVAQSQTENGTVCRRDTRAVQQTTQYRPIHYLSMKQQYYVAIELGWNSTVAVSS